MPEASGSGVADESDYSTFENKTGLAEDMKFLASMPELCDVTFLVGDTKEPVCAVKAVLAARSRVFHKMLYQTPSPQRKKEPPPRENKIRLFLKRSSEPLLNLQNAAQQLSGFTQQLAPIQEPNQHHTIIIEEFEPDVFRQLIEYIHTGCVTLQPRTLLGVMNAADYYGLDELRRACAGFVQCCITVDTVCALLASAERYIQYKCTKSLVQKVLEYVDEHGNEVLNLGSFTLLPQHVVRLILAREELRADEFTKFQAALMWSKKYCDGNQNTPLKDVLGNFLEYIQFHKIPATVLMREVYPLELVPAGIIMNSLAYQADPSSVDPGKLSPHRVRREGRSMSVQSSLDPYGSNITLSSSVSDVGSDQKQHTGKNGIAEQDTAREQQHRQQRSPKQRDEEDLQQQIELRNQLQQQRQGQEQKRQQEEELKRLRHEVELKRLQQEVEVKRQRYEEELRQQELLKKQQQEDELKKQQEEENLKRQQEQESLKRQQEQEHLKQQREQEESKKQQDEQELQREQGTQDEPQQQEKEEEPMQEELPKKEEDQEQKIVHEDKQLRLQLEQLQYFTLQRELMFQKQEEALQLQVQKKRHEEQLEFRQLHQLQLHLEGRKPEEKSADQQHQVEKRKAKRAKKDRVEIRVREPEFEKQDQQLQEQQRGAAPVEGVGSLYIRLVVRQEGRANLVWLLKTHKF